MAWILGQAGEPCEPQVLGDPPHFTLSRTPLGSSSGQAFVAHTASDAAGLDEGEVRKTPR